MSLFMRLAAATALLVLPVRALAAPTWGPEFTFTNQKLIHGQDFEGIETRDHIIEYFKKLCASRAGAANACTVREIRGTYRVEYTGVSVGESPEPLWFQITADPGCIEVQTTPMTLKEWRLHRDLLQQDIFDTALNKFGLAPHPSVGGGHLNLGLESAFGDDLDAFVDFLVDVSNHPELGMGAFGEEDLLNAPVLSRLDLKQRRAFAHLVAEQRAGRIRTIEEFCRKLQNEVYYKSPLEESVLAYLHHKNQAVNVRSVVDDNVPTSQKRAELRANQAQGGVDDLIEEGKLFEARMSYLKHQRAAGHPVVFQDAPLIKSPEDGVNRYRAFVEECGLQWHGKDGHRSRVSREWKKAAKKARAIPVTEMGPAARSCNLPALLKAALEAESVL